MRGFRLLFMRWLVPNRLVVTAFLLVGLCGPAPAIAGPVHPAVTYLRPEMSNISAATLRQGYAWRRKMDFMLAPIHTRADLKRYLNTNHPDSPLQALPAGAAAVH